MSGSVFSEFTTGETCATTRAAFDREAEYKVEYDELLITNTA